MKLPNRFGSITKYKDANRRKPYIVRVNGKYIGATPTYQEALAMLTDYHRNPIEEKTATFSEVYELWMKQKSGTISPHTVRNYKSKYNTFCKPIYDKPYTEIGLTDYLNVINIDPKASNGTKNNIIKFLRAMDRFAYDLGLIERKFAENLDYYKKQPTKRRRLFEPEEIEILWEHLDIPNIDIVLILLYTGLRSGELADLLIQDIHLEENYLIAGKKTEAGTDRYIPIHPRIKPLIENRINLSNRSTLFNFKDKQLRINFHKALKPLNMDEGRDCHTCRHTFITRLDDLGANHVCIQLIVGHKNNDVTMDVYTHKTKDQLQETVRLLP